MKKTNYKVIIYTRVSTEEQAEKGYSIESQIDKCLAKAKHLHFSDDEVLILTDHCTGASMERPSLTKLREILKSHDQKPEIIIIYEPDRLARNLTHQLIITDEILKNGVRLEFVAFEWKDTPEGKMFYQLRGIFAEYEREKIRERTIRGRMTKIKKHGKLSVNPRIYGYQFHTEDDVLIKHPEESKVVRLLFHLAAKGKSGEEIAKYLAQNGIPAPRGLKWYGSTITRILHNKSYLGTFMAYKTDYHQGYKRNRPVEEQFPIPIEPIINATLFKKAQEMLEKNRTTKGRPHVREYLLSGLGKCYCGKSMVASVKSGNRQYMYYTCTGKHKRVYDSETKTEVIRCKSQYWNSQIVDEVVWSKMKSILINQEDMVLKVLNQVDGQLTNRNEQMIEYALISDKVKLIKHKKNKLIDLFLTNHIDQDQIEARHQLLNEEVSKLESRLIELNKEYTFLQEQIENKLSDNTILQTYRQSLSSLSFQQKKQVLHYLVNKIIFHQDRKLEIVLNSNEEFYNKYFKTL